MMCKNPYGGVPKAFFFIYKKTFGAPMGTPVMGALWVSILGALWASILGTLPASILGPLRASILGALRATIMVMWISNYSHVYPFSKRINSLLYVACEPTGQSSFGCNWLSV